MKIYKKLIALATALIFTWSMCITPVMAETIKVEGGSIDVDVKDNATNWNVTGNPVWNVPEFNVPTGNIYNIAGLNQGASLALLVNGGSASNIFGTMNLSNLDFILQNIAGINIGASAMINLNNASLIASTLPLNTNVTDFLARQYEFSGQGGFLTNDGKIVGNNADLVALVANALENRGTIEVPMGTVALAAGNTVTVGISPDGMVSIGVDPATANTMGLTDQIKNSGSISADGGKVILNAQAMDGLFEKAIRIEKNANAVTAIKADDGTIQFQSMDDIYNDAILQAMNGQIVMESQSGSIEMAGDIKASKTVLNADKVKLVGEDAQTLAGDITITNLEITTPGKTIYFEAGRTYTFLGTTKIEGAQGGYETYIKLFSSEKGSPWYVDMSSSNYSLSRVAVGDSYNINEELIYAKPKADYGGNTGWAHNDSIISWYTLQHMTLGGTHTLDNSLSSSSGDYTGIGNNFTPIGTSGSPFTGDFDGQGYTISDLVINKPGQSSVGLFGYTDGSEIRNIGLIDVDINGFANVGALSGEAYSSLFENTYSTGEVVGAECVGGLVGYLYGSTISKSYSASIAVQIS
jgi:filamentous hemagglutinin family protein